MPASSGPDNFMQCLDHCPPAKNSSAISDAGPGVRPMVKRSHCPPVFRTVTRCASRPALMQIACRGQCDRAVVLKRDDHMAAKLPGGHGDPAHCEVLHHLLIELTGQIRSSRPIEAGATALGRVPEQR